MSTYPVRILLVFGQLNRGGAETLAMNIFRNVDRNKLVFDFIVHTNEHCDYDDEVESLGGKIYRFPRYNGINHFAYKKCWNDFFETHSEYRVIHAHMTGSASVFLPIAKKFGLYTISHSHIAESQSGFHQFVVDLYRLPLKNCSDYMFACSEIAGEWMFGKDIAKRDNYSILKNGVDAEKFSYSDEYRMSVRNELNINENTFVVGNISRFHIQKNHSFLIDIFYEINKKYKDSVLLLVGNGELRKEIENKVKALGLKENVIFTGVRTDVDRILSAIDVFCMPSFREGLPVSLVEAQASGVHIVVSDTVSEEIKITDLVEYQSLDSNADVWADAILKYSVPYQRENTKQQIVDSGYDIKNTAAWLQEFYLRRINE